jgi:hypothetical protein
MNAYVCPVHSTHIESGLDCPKCMEDEWMSFSDQGEDPTPAFDDMNMAYVCAQCGCPVNGAEADDNGGLCETCAAGGEYPIDE